MPSSMHIIGPGGPSGPEVAELKALQARYFRAMHGVQSGIKLLLERGSDMASPKHLRTGLNSALIDSGAIAGLLIKKGLITEVEYLTAIAEGAEAEREKLETEVSKLLGHDIKLG